MSQEDALWGRVEALIVSVDTLCMLRKGPALQTLLGHSPPTLPSPRWPVCLDWSELQPLPGSAGLLVGPLFCGPTGQKGNDLPEALGA